MTIGFFRRTKRLSLGLFAAVFLSGCVFWGGREPLETLTYRFGPSCSESAIVFLRGRGGSPEDFAENGFVDEVLRRRLPYDMMAPNAHFGYYFSRTLVPRLKQDVIDPAKAGGYRRVWLVGASMGGLGALMYLRSHPEDVEGVYLISPFLGLNGMIKEIAKSGGVRSWSPGEYDPEDDWNRMLWDWLKQYSENPSAWPPIYLGYGTEDRFHSAHRLLGQILPAERVYETQGGHTPEAMKKVWDLFLDGENLEKPY